MDLHEVIVFVKDFDAAVDFYRNKLGLEFELDEEGIAHIPVGRSYLVLHSSPADEPLPSPLIVLEVDNLEERAAEIRRRGVEVPEVVYQYFGAGTQIRDPDGNVLSLSHHRQASV